MVNTLRRSGASVERDGRLVAAAEHTDIDPVSLTQPWPGDPPVDG